MSERLNKGDSDTKLAERSHEEGWVIVTYDDDFWTDFSESAYGALLYFPDQSLSARQVADILHEISTYYDQEQLVGSQKVGRSWLD